MISVWSADAVQDVFSSGASWFPRSPQADYGDLANHLRSGRLSAERFEYAPVGEPPFDPDPEKRFEDEIWVAWLASGQGSGGYNHGMLKWWAWNWLRSAGEPAPVYEQPYQLGKADLLAPSLRWVVECGDTSPERVMPALSSGRWKAFVVIPYAYRSPELGRVDYHGWIFRLPGT